MRGFTLIELMVALVILGAFLALGIPAMNQLHERYDSRAAYFRLQQVLTNARIKSLEEVTELTVCPMSEKTCSNNWDDPIHVFEDTNLNQTLDDNEKLYFVAHIDSRFGYWQKTKANQNYVRFNELGHAFSSASTFLYCPFSDRDSLAKSIVINFQGRIRTGHYLNSRGVPYAAFNNINCQ